MRGPFRALAGAVAAVRTLMDTGSACGAVQQGLPCWRAHNAPAGVAGQWLQQTSGHGVGPPPCVRSLHSTAATGSGSSTIATADQKQRQKQRRQQQQQQAQPSHSRGRSAGSGGGGGRGRVGGSGTIDPPLLTVRIKGADSLGALQQLEAEHGGGFDHIHAAAAFTRAAHLVSSGAAWPLDAHPLLQRLSARLRPLFDDCGTREHANTLWACGKTAYVDAALLDACFARLAAGVADAAPQGLANALYAAALLQAAGYGVDRRQAAQLLSALVEQRQAAKPQALANTLWAAATLQLAVPEHQAALLLCALVAQRQAAKPQDISNTLWAAATLKLAVPEQQAALLLCALVAQQQAAKPQDISNTLWAAATLKLAVPEQQATQLLSALVAQQQAAKPQEISNTLWAAATLKLAVPDQQAAQLLFALVAQRQVATPQALANTLWAAATLQLAVPEHQAAQLLSALVAQRQTAKPQDISNTLWAAATLQLTVPEQQAAQLLSALVAQRQAAKPQDISNTLWAAAKLWGDAMPTDVEAALLRLAAAIDERLVAALNGQEVSNSLWALLQLGLRPAPLTQRLADAAVPLAPAMTPQHLANTALAAAKLGVGGVRLFVALTGAAGRQAPQGFTTQDLCNLAWALAVADQRQLAGAAVALAQRAAAAEVWAQTVAEEHCQLHQVHLWLVDGQRADSGSGSSSSGLAGALTAAQLQQCKEAWEAALQDAAQQHRRTAFERSVFECARRLPGLADCRQEARTPDGAFSVDVAALHAASGLRLAMEADGPTHFLRPGREVGGHTLARNRALSARGCVVVSVPYWEWAKVQRDAGKAAAYLSQAVEDAVARWQQQGESGSGGGSVGGRSGEAAPAA
ncbi:hypothetical protein Rsub_04097 [Raphidocelis subcapitata]|uniref:RAP domain-containing protein n=1 Tax=Raphidocelis subcapitata TaxID=307507 RepID=A0A2V0P2D4_9CHLO|nr:hypothetical protein Rsub_04097 [Raphidocelis subcapitata]|eukprot:GBF91357.1 hypothetical protein Rsub_04097 [Raphidocelis subcapitata]